MKEYSALRLIASLAGERLTGSFFLPFQEGTGMAGAMHGDCGRDGRCGENRFDRVDSFNREDRCDRNWKNGDWGREGRFGQEGMKKAETFAGLGFLCFRVSMHYYISESFLYPS